MRITKKVKVPEKVISAHEMECLEAIACDLCGAKSEYGDDWVGTYDVAEVTVSFRTGVHYPEGGGGTITKFDICPKCFKDRLVPWIESQGGKATTEEWDW